MSQTRVCPDCGVEIPANSPAGQCPKCLLKEGFRSGVSSEHSLDATAPSPASTGFEPPPIEQLAPHFPQLELLELIGKGGMGAVYKARQKGLDRLVAVKILPPEVGRDPAFAERFTREARAMARLSHPHIVSIYDFGQSNGQFYFVMEYIDGANLRQLTQSKQLTPAEALAVVPQICDALQFAHDEGIVHRDIKPENILVDKRGRVKIADFGLSKLLGEQHADVSLTGTHQVMGTLRYMAPEQMEGTKSVDHRADIYSLGVVFYELLTGQAPMGRFDPPSKKVHIDVRLDEVVLRALEQDPEKRYQQASEVKTGVQAILLSQPTSPFIHKSVTGGRLSASSAAPPLSPAQIFVRGVLWLAVAVGIVTFVWFEKRTMFDGRGGAVSTISVGGGQPWLTFGDDPAGGKYFSPNFATISALAGLGAVVAGIGLYSLRRQRVAAAALPGKVDPSGGHGGTPLAHIRFAVDESSEVPRLAKFHFFARGYELVEERPDVCVFHRGTKAAGLWNVDIGRYHTTLTVRTAPIVDPKAWVSCDWSVVTMGAWIRRGDISKLETEGREFAAILHANVETVSSASPTRPTTLPRAGLAELAAVCVGLGILVPILLYVFTQDLMLTRIALVSGQALAVLLGLLSFRRLLGQYASLLGVVVLGAYSGVQLFVNYRQMPIKYPWHGDTGFVETADGPALSDTLARKLGIPVAQQKAADRIFQDYYRQYAKLERQHTTHTRDANGRVHVTIEPFADEMLELTKSLRAEMGGVIHQGMMPPMPERGKVHSQLGLFRFAGEATVGAELWKGPQSKDGDTHFYQEKVAWIDGQAWSYGASGRSSAVFPERYRLYWVEPENEARTAAGSGALTTDHLAAAYRDAHNRRDAEAALRLFYIEGIPGFDESALRGQIMEGFTVDAAQGSHRKAKAATFQFVPGDAWLEKYALPPKLTLVGKLSVELEDPVPAPPSFTSGFIYLVGRLDNGTYYLTTEVLKGHSPVQPNNPGPVAPDLASRGREAKAAYEPLARGTWRPRFDTADDVARGPAMLEAGVITLRDFLMDRADKPVFFRDGIVRAKLEGFGSVHLRCTGDSYQLALLDDGLHICKWQKEMPVRLASVPADEVPKAQVFRELALVAIGGHLIGFLDGKRMLELIDRSITNEGVAAIHAHQPPVQFKDVEVMSLDGVDVKDAVGGLAVLDQFVGAWNLEHAARPSQKHPVSTVTSGKIATRWVLGGRYVRSDYDLGSDPGPIVLSTYDPLRDEYPTWVFTPAGPVVYSPRKWNPIDRSLGGNVSDEETGTTVHHHDVLHTDRTIAGTLLVTDKDGRKVFDVSDRLLRAGDVAPAAGPGKTAAGPADDVPQLKVLAPLIGEFTAEAGMTDADGIRTTFPTGCNQNRWIMHGRILEERGQTPDGATETHLNLWTYDTEKYYSWYFPVLGSRASEAFGWDESARALVGQGTLETGAEMTSHVQLSDPDLIKWTMTPKAPGGNGPRFDGHQTRIKN